MVRDGDIWAKHERSEQGIHMAIEKNDTGLEESKCKDSEVSAYLVCSVHKSTSVAGIQVLLGVR